MKNSNAMTIIFDHFRRQRLLEQSATEDDVGTPVGPGSDGSTPDMPEEDTPSEPPAAQDDPASEEPAEDDPSVDAAAQAAGLSDTGEEGLPTQPDQFSEFMVEYLKTLQKYADNPKLLREVLKVARDLDDLSPSQRSFIETNISAVSLLTESVVVDAQKQVRRNMKDMDAWESVAAQLEAIPELEVAIQRMAFSGPDKSNLFRQLFAALIGGAVFPGPTGGEVLVLPKGQDEPTSYRPHVYTTWGMVDMGPLVLNDESIGEYLAEEEQSKLESGAPEEKKVLRNRLIIEALSDQLGGGEYIIVVIHPSDGSWESIRLSSEWFRDAYEAGQITVIEASPQPTGGLAVDEDGNFVTMADWGLALINKEESVDPVSGEPIITKEPIAIIDGKRMILTADMEQIEKMGIELEKHMWKRGDPEELKKQQRNVPDAREKLMKRD